jgi:hypothetical protein
MADSSCPASYRPGSPPNQTRRLRQTDHQNPPPATIPLTLDKLNEPNTGTEPCCAQLD